MKFVFIISTLLTVAVAQEPSLSCTYHLYGQFSYTCDLTINNPNGLDNFTNIEGIHLEGFANADVERIFRADGISTNIPSVICETFPNVIEIYLYNAEVIEISDTSFGSCTRATDIYLWLNRISSISANAFANLPDLTTIDLQGNLLRTLPENVFASQQSLTTLHLSDNPFEDIPVGVFQSLPNLEVLYIQYANVTNTDNWFANNQRLRLLDLTGNGIELSADSFVGVEELVYLFLADNAISEIPPGTFAGLPNLQSLYLYANNFTDLQADSFQDLENLDYLDLSSNRIPELNSNSFENLGNLTFLSLNFNEIEELPQGVFVPLPNLNYIGLWNNRLKSLHRNSFGTLTSLQTLDLDENVVNAVDRAIIDDAVNLSILYFNRNLCASNSFWSFEFNRVQYLPQLETCFTNIRYIVATTTEGDEDYSFFEGAHPGIAFRVNSDNEVLIAFTPFEIVWNPIIEVIIGAANNTQTIIRRNQETDVATVPTPNILSRGQWNDFRVTWANQVILVYRGNDVFPFMAYTLQDFVPINFYGLRAIETSASWTVQPFDW